MDKVLDNLVALLLAGVLDLFLLRLGLLVRLDLVFLKPARMLSKTVSQSVHPSLRRRVAASHLGLELLEFVLLLLPVLLDLLLCL